MNKLGIMQGRLSPMIDGKIQAFPKINWKKEFSLAKKIGFTLIEWVLDRTDLDSNPLLSEEGRQEINRQINEYNIEVPSVCCDYFIEFPLHSESLNHRIQAKGMLFELIQVCPQVGIKYIEIPLIGKSSIKKAKDANYVVDLFNSLVPLLANNDLHFVLETDLKPSENEKLFNRFFSNRIQLNYDTGNSAYWSFNIEDELPVYGTKIGNVHIKDCTPRDYSVTLGTGNVDFERTFELLKKINYTGDFILQTVRGKNDYELAKSFYEFTNNYITGYLK